MKLTKLLTKLKELNLPKDEFTIFGSGPLGIRKIRDVNDLDILVSKKLWNELIKKYHIEHNNKDSIKIGKIEIFKDWLPWFDNIYELIEKSDIFNSIRFVKLEYVITFKKMMNREKDKADIKLIEEYY